VGGRTHACEKVFIRIVGDRGKKDTCVRKWAYVWEETCVRKET